MSKVPTPSDDSTQRLLTEAPAANADEIEATSERAPIAQPGSGWDAYEVWRRLIKDPRSKPLPK